MHLLVLRKKLVSYFMSIIRGVTNTASYSGRSVKKRKVVIHHGNHERKIYRFSCLSVVPSAAIVPAICCVSGRSNGPCQSQVASPQLHNKTRAFQEKVRFYCVRHCKRRCLVVLETYLELLSISSFANGT